MLTKSKRRLAIKLPGYGIGSVRNVYYVISNLRDGWNVRRDGARRAFRSFRTRSEAIRCGQAMARKHGADLSVHNDDASIFALFFYRRKAVGQRKRAG